VSTHDLKALLPRSFYAFLGRFPRPSAIQTEAIPLICSGKDVLIMAPTASGKTEAFAAPAAERVFQAGRGTLRVLILSPTRALANDLYRRLESRYEDLAIKFGRYTGEHKDFANHSALPDVVIATPEALDSLLARRSHLLSGVQMVVMDEIHILDNTVRGDHLRVLLHRLAKITRGRPQCVAVSATVDQPEALASRYLRKGTAVSVPGRRAILLQTFEGGGDLSICHHLDRLADHGLRKILIFCNSRAHVEHLTRALREHSRFRERIFPHHGSLSQPVRERAEEQFLVAPAGVAVATMTLEIGIDIGSVDYVLLAGMPNSISSLLQRIGRGNRRSGKTRAGYTVDSERDRILGEAMFRAARDGRLLGGRYGFRPSVLLQQALVLAASQDWVSAETLRKSVPTDLWEESNADPEELIDALIEHGHLHADLLGRATASDATQDLYDNGKLHSNLDSEPEMSIIDRITGEVVGTMTMPDIGRVQLGGSARNVIKVEGEEILTDRSKGEGTPQFSTKGIPLMSRSLAREVLEQLPLPDAPTLSSDEMLVFSLGARTILLHGLGTIGNALLGAVLRNNTTIVQSGPLGMEIAGPLHRLPSLSEDSLRSVLHRHERSISKLCALGPWHRYLPKPVRLRALEHITDLSSLSETLLNARLRRATLPPLLAESLATLSGR
jgi:ATP-dependent Lhr-like helicase